MIQIDGKAFQALRYLFWFQMRILIPLAFFYALPGFADLPLDKALANLATALGVVYLGSAAFAFGMWLIGMSFDFTVLMTAIGLSRLWAGLRGLSKPRQEVTSRRFAYRHGPKVRAVISLR